MATPEEKPGPRREFGRVVQDPNRHNGKPFLRELGIEVEDVLALIKQGLNDNQIINKLPELTKRDIDSCRSWQARFMTGTLSSIFNRVSNQNVIMLDENVSYRALYDVVRIFGRSSHVRADGLFGDHNDDEKDIWAHAVQKGYLAVVTNDRDFYDISSRYREKMINKYGSIHNCPHHVPVVVRVPSLPPERLVALLEKHQDNIRKFMKDNDAIYAEITMKGFYKGPPDYGRSRFNIIGNVPRPV